MFRWAGIVRAFLIVGLGAVTVVGPSRPALGWGDKGHDMVNRLAAEGMPPETPRFFKNAATRLGYLGPEPDRWPGLSGDSEALVKADRPDHFLDLEYVAGLTLPRNRYDYIRLLIDRGVAKGDVKIETPGFLPYRVAELTQMLRRQWQLWRAATGTSRADRDRRKQIEENILHIAGVMGHYVGDGGNPHHTTWHYNGWVVAREPNPEGFTTERGVHGRFETEFVDAAVEIADVRSLVPAPRPIADVFSETLLYLRGSHALVRDLYRLDNRNAFRVAPANAAANAEGKRFVVQRLAAAAGMLRDIWASAMVP